ncbi:ferritin-like domain-containing protein [Kitasatospora sp. LaBMicrA B282]|uniref:ferritin-like domain-containing protein n=1 Tax=Kitasatospora sp. LaBMicrA B282 TaxID=3420949 RepID=UPI003D13D35A
MKTKTSAPESQAAPAAAGELTPLFEMPADFACVPEITTLPQLAAHLKVAAKVEMCTIPPYLYAAYSIRTKGYSQWSPGVGAFRTLLGIAIEEMLHLCLVRNLLLAIGEDTVFASPNFIPSFPGPLPHHTPRLELHLERLSKKLVREKFMPLELPEPRSEYYEEEPPVREYRTLGEFYRRIRDGFVYLDGEIDWANCNKDRQYHRGYWNQNGGGSTLLVTDLPSALNALDTIIDQGEGADPKKGTVPKNPVKPVPGLEEYTHYEKFRRMSEGIEGIGAVDGTREDSINIDTTLAVGVLVTDPHLDAVDQREHPALHALTTLFNAAFTCTLHLLDELYATPVTDTTPKEFVSHRYHLERTFVSSMQGILYPIAELLTRTPTGRTRRINGRQEPEYAGPPFEFHAFGHGGYEGWRIKPELHDRCLRAISYFPELGGEDGVLRQIALLPDVSAAGSGS